MALIIERVRVLEETDLVMEVETAATADCAAVGDVSTYFLPGDVLAGLLRRHPRLAIGLIRLLSRRLMATLRPDTAGDGVAAS